MAIAASTARSRLDAGLLGFPGWCSICCPTCHPARKAKNEFGMHVDDQKVFTFPGRVMHRVTHCKKLVTLL